MADRRLRNTAPDLEATFYVGETPTDPSPATATVTLTRADGTLIGAANQATTRIGVGNFRYTLDETHTTNLDNLTLAWTATFSGNPQTITTYVEIVGGFYASLVEIRAFDPQLAPAAISTAEIEDARAWAENAIETAADVAFVPRFARDEVDGTGRDSVMLSHRRPRRIISATIDDVAVSDLTLLKLRRWGLLLRDDGPYFTWGIQNIAVNYEHGYDSPPEDILKIFFRMVRRELLGEQSGPQEQEALVPEEFSGGPTGVRQWDNVLLSYRVPQVA